MKAWAIKSTRGHYISWGYSEIAAWENVPKAYTKSYADDLYTRGYRAVEGEFTEREPGWHNQRQRAKALFRRASIPALTLSHTS